MRVCIKLICVVSFAVIAGCGESYPETARETGQPISISPDYANITIPCNIAPLNFKINHEAGRYAVKIHSDNGDPIVINNASGCIEIPLKPWKRLLSANKGNELLIDIAIQDNNNDWSSFKTIKNKISSDPIDGYMAYRKILPIHNNWANVSIYQRSLENFKERAIFQGGRYGNSCVNCHTFNSNNPDSLFLGIRNQKFGSSTILATGKKAEKIGSKWGYTSWHPSGQLAAYSINKVRQFFYSANPEVRDVVDLDSVIVYYNLKDKKVKTCDAVSDKERLETYPTWSPDGKHLYYCSAPILWQDRETTPPLNYDKVKYDLRRVSYDLATDTWGESETVIKADDVNKSILLPRITPDGKYLVFCMCDYGCFPIYQASSDLYIMNLETQKYRKLDINSEYSESWHSFSSNSRWMTFSSKRNDGLLTRSYFAYIDREGKVHKPFVLPQKNPVYYESCLYTYSVPEMITGPVKVSQAAIARAIRGKKQIDITLPITGATPTTAPTSPWKERE